MKNVDGILNCIVKKCDESPKPYESDGINIFGSSEYNENEWKSVRSKYCEQSGNIFYNKGENSWQDCTDDIISYCQNNNTGENEICDSCTVSKKNFKDSECLYLEAEDRIAQCGNNIIEGDEQCDDGNTNDNDGCSLCQETEIN